MSHRSFGQVKVSVLEIVCVPSVCSVLSLIGQEGPRPQSVGPWGNVGMLNFLQGKPGYHHLEKARP